MNAVNMAYSQIILIGFLMTVNKFIPVWFQGFQITRYFVTIELFDSIPLSDAIVPRYYFHAVRSSKKGKEQKVITG
jgi:hypothetical protein